VYARPVAFTAMSSQSKSHVVGRLGSFAVDPATAQRIACPVTALETNRHFVVPVGDWNPSTAAGAGGCGRNTVVPAAVDVAGTVMVGAGAVVGTDVVETGVVDEATVPIVVVAPFVVVGGLISVTSTAVLFDGLASTKPACFGAIEATLVITPVAEGFTVEMNVNTSGTPGSMMYPVE
jgi:hypothetical protein